MAFLKISEYDNYFDLQHLYYHNSDDAGQDKTSQQQDKTTRQKKQGLEGLR